jgi:hypothetical protein
VYQYLHLLLYQDQSQYQDQNLNQEMEIMTTAVMEKLAAETVRKPTVAAKVKETTEMEDKDKILLVRTTNFYGKRIPNYCVRDFLFVVSGFCFISFRFPVFSWNYV